MLYQALGHEHGIGIYSMRMKYTNRLGA
jgi:hypothetical protein